MPVPAAGEGFGESSGEGVSRVERLDGCFLVFGAVFRDASMHCLDEHDLAVQQMASSGGGGAIGLER